jgi:hypothetical protein
MPFVVLKSKLPLILDSYTFVRERKALKDVYFMHDLG